MPVSLRSFLITVLTFAVVSVLGPTLAAQIARSGTPTQRTVPWPPGLMLVSGYDSDAIHVFHIATGAFVGTIGPVPGAQSITTGPDGMLYACAEKIDQVLRIDPATLTITGAFVADDPATPEDENSRLDGPTGAIFGPDGNLYVASFDNDRVLRFDGASGAFLNTFVAAGSGGLDGPDAGMTFGPDGNLYVPSFWNHRVLRYDGTTGAFLDVFISSSPSNLFQPRGVVFHAGSCYVASSLNHRVLRYDLAGNFLGIFANANRPYGMAFNPDDHDLYVVSLGLNLVRIHDGATGAYLQDAIPSGAGGLVNAVYVHFVR
jgi:DNA-binding beta-propeller fold protein YncE